MNGKRIFSVLTLVCLLLCLAGCKEKKEVTASTEAVKTTSPVEATQTEPLEVMDRDQPEESTEPFEDEPLDAYDDSVESDPPETSGSEEQGKADQVQTGEGENPFNSRFETGEDEF